MPELKSLMQGHIASTITRITERFEVDKQLDRGTFGAVFRCYDRKHGCIPFSFLPVSPLPPRTPPDLAPRIRAG